LAIGAFLYEAIAKWLIDLYSHDERLDQFRALYAQWAGQSFSLSNRSFTSDRHSGKAVKAVPTF
jgi:hypothetical protein